MWCMLFGIVGYCSSFMCICFRAVVARETATRKREPSRSPPHRAQKRKTATTHSRAPLSPSAHHNNEQRRSEGGKKIGEERQWKWTVFFCCILLFCRERGTSLKKVLRIAEGPTALRGVRTTLLVKGLGDSVEWNCY